MAGRKESKLKQTTRSSEKKEKEGGLQIPFLSSALLLRKEMDAYGYGDPVMINPEERLVHKKLLFRLKKSTCVKPDLFTQMLANRKRSLRRFEEDKGKVQVRARPTSFSFAFSALIPEPLF